ncbi:MAG TPA: hypothetical protein VNW49_09405 [Puia sp.]|nr:hypothetical protein [Puia sp.]
MENNSTQTSAAKGDKTHPKNNIFKSADLLFDPARKVYAAEIIATTITLNNANKRRSLVFDFM